MPNLIDTLKSDHAVILTLVLELQSHLHAEERALLRLGLTKLKGALVDHLHREGAALYPGLIRMAEQAGDEPAASVSRVFQANMKEFSSGLLAFLEQYEGEQFDLARFDRDWKSMVELLGSHIATEETLLYPMFEQAAARVS